MEKNWNHFLDVVISSKFCAQCSCSRCLALKLDCNNQLQCEIISNLARLLRMFYSGGMTTGMIMSCVSSGLGREAPSPSVSEL